MRAQAAVAGDVLAGHGILWRRLGHAELAAIEVPPARRGEITVAVSATVVSCGTERARHLGMPNARVDFPHRPGYAAAGVVVELGPGASRFATGDRVALLDVPHQSVATVPAERCYHLPAGVALEDAAVLQLGVVAAQGVRRAGAGIREGGALAVIGMGLVGSLAQRIAVGWGAGPCTAVAASRAKAEQALAGGAERFLSLDHDAEAVAGLSAPVVIEATGDPDGLALAVAAAAPGGRVVLLGSPRGLASRVPVQEIWRKRLQVVGAHVNRLKREQLPSAEDPIRREASAVLDALASRRLVVSDLFTAAVDPRDAGRFYRRLAKDRTIVGARFDWTGFPPGVLGRGRHLACAN
jgi:threonine dehydrogenase-like Zn-dependent dehydrogenase